MGHRAGGAARLRRPRVARASLAVRPPLTPRRAAAPLESRGCCFRTPREGSESPGDLLLDERGLEPLLGRYLVIKIRRVLRDLDVHPVDVASEAANGIVARHRGAGVGGDLERLVAREGERLSSLHPSLAYGLIVDEQRHGSALRRATAVVLELDAHVVRSRRHTFGALDVKEIDAVEVVTVLRTTVLHVPVS